MIAHPPQQQVHPYHLALSLVILLLTIYPYLFNGNSICSSVAAYSSDNFELKHSSLEKFDIIQSDDIILSKKISIRSTQEHVSQDLNFEQRNSNELDAIPHGELNQKRHIHFSSLGQRFHLVLNQPAHLISSDFNVIALDGDNKQTIVPINRNDLQILEGNLADDPTSRVTASISKQNKILTAQIKFGQDVIVVEPTYLHRDNLKSSQAATSTANETINLSPKLFEKTMIVYKLSDHDLFRQQDGKIKLSAQHDDLDKLCAAISLSNQSYYATTGELKQNKIALDSSEDVFKYNKSTKETKSKFIGSDRGVKKRRGIEFFYDQQEQPTKEKTRCTLHLVADYLFYKHVGNGDLQTTINYLLALINRVNQIYLPTQWETGDEKFDSFNNIGFTVQNITIHQEFTRLSSGDIHYNTQNDTKIWRARELLDNFSRYSPPKHYCLAHLLTYRRFDSPVLGLAYVASIRFGTIGGICSPTQLRGDAYYKHNTGISTSKGIYGETLITRQADLVLAHELGHNLGAEHDSNQCRPAPAQGGAYLMHPYAVMGFERNNRFLSNCSRLAIGRVIRRKASTCFIGVVDNVCGNGVVEDGEECDGGDVGHGHSDPCCDSSCRFTPGSQCSDRHSWCCSKCHIVPAGRPCRPAEEFNCKQAVYCDGRSGDCPIENAPPVENDKICVGRGLCRSGECVPFCEAHDLFSCLCNTPADACKLCCKQSINGTCLPYDQKAPYLPDGVLCYRGVCEKGRCEQPIQDVVERLWDVIEDINLTTFAKFLRDNIILVVLVVSIPLWCLITHFINEFDRSIKQDVINTILKHRRRKPPPPTQSPFLPRLFVGDENSSTNSLNDLRDDVNQPLKEAFHYPDPRGGARAVPPPPPPSYLNNNNNHDNRQRIQHLPPPHRTTIGFRPPTLGFQFCSGEEVVMEPRSSIVLNSIELPHRQENGSHAGELTTNDIDEESTTVNDNEFNPSSIYSTQV